MKGSELCYMGDSCISVPFSATTTTITNLFEGANPTAYYNKILGLLTTAAKEEQEDSVVSKQCGLYLAPSTLPHAGLGLFSGTDIPQSHSVNEYIGFDDDNDTPIWTDLFIPIADDYKALPYRGQQRFPSWLQYIWPKHHGALANEFHSSPDVPHVLWDFDLGLNFADKVEFYTYTGDQKERINAFSPGLASLANSHVWFSNIEKKEYKMVNDKDYNLTLLAPRQSGTGPLTLPDQLVEFSVSKSSGIQAGMELVSSLLLLRVPKYPIVKLVAQLLTSEVYFVISSFSTMDKHGIRIIMKSSIGYQRRIPL
jgi:hypothetical protein